MNQILIEHLDRAAWKAKPPGKARTIAAIFTPVHNVRTRWSGYRSAPEGTSAAQARALHAAAGPGGIGRERRSLRRPGCGLGSRSRWYSRLIFRVLRAREISRQNYEKKRPALGLASKIRLAV
jgi:hypothetical protein